MGQYTAPYPPSALTPLAPTTSGTIGISTSFARDDHTHPAQTSVSGSSGSTNGNAATATKLQTARTINGVSFDGSTNITLSATAITVTPSTPTRTLGTAFQPSTTNPVLCLYSIQIACTASLTGGQAGQVQLLSDTSNPPTTVRATIANQNTSGLTIGLTVVNNQTAVLPYLVPIGHYVKLVSTNTTGTPTYAMISQTEAVLG